MARTRHPRLRTLGEAEQEVMDYIWAHGAVTARLWSRLRSAEALLAAYAAL